MRNRRPERNDSVTPAIADHPATSIFPILRPDFAGANTPSGRSASQERSRNGIGRMSHSQGSLFKAEVWSAALNKYGAVTHLTVNLYDDEQRIVCGPAPSSAIF